MARRLGAIATCLLAPVLAGTFAFVCAARHSWGWALHGVGFVPRLEFEDLRVVTYTASCVRSLPHWTLHSPSCDPWGRTYNYPAAWARGLAALHLGREDTMWLGYVLIGAWVVAAGLLAVVTLRRAPLAARVMLALCLVSPPVFFALERGNVDIVVYLLEVVALLLVGTRRWLVGGLLLTLAAYLKLFPLGALAGLVVVRRHAVLAGFASLTVLALASEASGIAHAAASTPQGAGVAFGPAVLVLRADPSTDAGHARIGGFIILVTLAAATWALWRWLTRFGEAKRDLVARLESDRMALALFAGGTGLLTIVLMEGTNYDYRLIHTTLIVAALGRVWASRLARWLTLGLVAASWFSFRFAPLDATGDLVLVGVAGVICALLASLVVRWWNEPG